MKKNLKNTLLTVSDVLFVLILCFVVLLTTMLLTKSASGAGDYRIHPLILGGVIVSIGGYLSFMLKRSLALLREMTDGCAGTDGREQKVEK